MQLPPLLTDALTGLLEGVPRKELAAAAMAISQGYRAGKPSHAIATPIQALAYAVARMPATHAAASAVFARLADVGLVLTHAPSRCRSQVMKVVPERTTVRGPATTPRRNPTSIRLFALIPRHSGQIPLLAVFAMIPARKPT